MIKNLSLILFLFVTHVWDASIINASCDGLFSNLKEKKSYVFKVDGSSALPRLLETGDEVKFSFDPIMQSLDPRYGVHETEFLYGKIRKLVTDDHGETIGVMLERLDSQGVVISSPEEFEDTIIWLNDIRIEESMIKKAGGKTADAAVESVKYSSIKKPDSGDFMMRTGGFSTTKAPVSLYDKVVLSYHDNTGPQYRNRLISGNVVGFEYENGTPIALKVLADSSLRKPLTVEELAKKSRDIKTIHFDDIIITEHESRIDVESNKGIYNSFDSLGSPIRKKYDGAPNWRPPASTGQGASITLDTGDFMIPLNSATQDRGRGKQIPLSVGDAVSIHFKTPVGRMSKGGHNLLITQIVHDSAGIPIGFKGELYGTQLNSPDFVYKFSDMTRERSYVLTPDFVSALWEKRVNQTPPGLKKATPYESDINWENDYAKAQNDNAYDTISYTLHLKILKDISPRKESAPMLSLEDWMKKYKIDSKIAKNKKVKRAWALWELGLTENASEKEIAKSIRTHFQKIHPDKFPNPTEEVKEKNTRTSSYLSQIKLILDKKHNPD
jgi:hypothetical protein